MDNKKYIKTAAAAIFILMTSPAYSSENGENVIYFGTGPSKTGNALKSNSAPLSLGYLKLSNSSDTVWGIDFSGEGTMLDSTGGRYNTVTRATAYNILAGKNLNKGENSRFDAAIVLGMRESVTSCPSSYIGYQCYADTAPDTKYSVNYGVVVSWNYKSLMIGLRATGESTQALLGFKF
jgi:hypothetical protein